MRSRVRAVALLSLLAMVTAAGCSAASARGGDEARRDQSVLTQADLRESGFTTVYQAVESLRPNWLRRRGPDSFLAPGQVQVYRDGIRVGGIEQLRAMETLGIAYVEYIDGIAAAGRWGLDHGYGVIFVSSHER